MNPLTSGSTNASSTLLSSLSRNSNSITDIQAQLSTNKKILDPAQQGVVTRLSSQVTSFGAAHNNIGKAQNVLSVTSTSLKTISNLLTQMQDLANKASDATMTTPDADKLQKTFAHLLSQIDSSADAAQVDGIGLMGSTSADLNIQTGLSATNQTTISAVKSDTGTLNIGTLDISTTAGAAAAITALKLALDTISTNQSSIAADQMALSAVDEQGMAISQNLQNTIDTIQKPDAAQLQMDLQNMNNQQSMNYYLINQMNQQAQAVLTIFR